MITIMDLDHVYKHIGVDTRSSQFAVISLSGPQGEIRQSYLNTQPFGPRRAPIQLGPGNAIRNIRTEEGLLGMDGCLC